MSMVCIHVYFKNIMYSFFFFEYIFKNSTQKEYLSYAKNLNFTAFCQLVLVILAEKHQSSAEKYLKLISTRLETYFY